MGDKPTLQFDAATHTYSTNGRPLPSVTGILRDVRQERFAVDQWYLDRGHIVHLCVRALIEGRLDWKSVDPKIVGRVSAIEKFLHDVPGSEHVTEIRLFSRRYQFAGTLDLAFVLPDSRLAIVDWKGTLDAWVQLQLGAYSIAWAEVDQMPSVVIGVESRDNGTYKSVWGTRHPKKDGASFDLGHAERTFLAAYTFRNWLVTNKAVKPMENKEAITE